MPILDGIAAAVEIRRLRPQNVQLLHTGLLVSEHRHGGQTLGLTVLDKLELPPTIERLAQAGRARPDALEPIH